MLTISDTLHRNIAFWGMVLIAIGLPLSVFTVSVGTFVLAGNWLLEGNYRQRLKRFFTDRLSVIMVSIYGIHLLGMIHTDQLQHGMDELRVKLPLLLMPLFLFTSKLPDRKRLQDILMVFVLACVVGTVFGFLHYLGITGEDIIEKRHLSVFISHIRFGLMLTLSFFILAFYLYTKWDHWSGTEKCITLSAMGWLFFFMVLLGSFTAYLAFVATLGFALLYVLLRSEQRLLQLAMVLFILIGVVASGLYLNRIYQNYILELPFTMESLQERTANGAGYDNKVDITYRENGHRVWNFVCFKEMEKEWPTRSNVDFQGLDKRGQEIKYTVLRYVTSKGLRKDSAAIHQLSDQDIIHIEKGFTNYRYTGKWGVSRRIDQFLWEMEEYRRNNNPNGSSLIQRWVAAKVGLSVFKKNLLIGVGTGDLVESYRNAYLEENYHLRKEYQVISHDQFLTIAICLGGLGLFVFVVALYYPLTIYWKDPLYVGFIILISVSFLSDNTLGSQSGVTLFAFFNALLMVRREFAQEGDQVR